MQHAAGRGDPPPLAAFPSPPGRGLGAAAPVAVVVDDAGTHGAGAGVAGAGAGAGAAPPASRLEDIPLATGVAPAGAHAHAHAHVALAVPGLLAAAAMQAPSRQVLVRCPAGAPPPPDAVLVGREFSTTGCVRAQQARPRSRAVHSRASR